MLTPMLTAFATTWTTASESSMLAAFAMVLVPSTIVDVLTSQKEIATATAIRKMP